MRNIAHLFDLDGNFVATLALSVNGCRDEIRLAVALELDPYQREPKPLAMPTRLFRQTMRLRKSGVAVYEEVKTSEPT